MIKAYLTAIPCLYEGEDIEVRYSLFKDEILMGKKSIYLEYMKPAIVGQASLLTLLHSLEEYRGEEIVIVMNDASLHEVIKDASTTKNIDVLKMARQTKKELAKFERLSFVNVSKDKEALKEWKEITGI